MLTDRTGDGASPEPRDVPARSDEDDARRIGPAAPCMAAASPLGAQAAGGGPSHCAT